MLKSKCNLKRIVIVLLCLAVAGAALLGGINLWVVCSTSDQLLQSEDTVRLDDVDCILVLGCYVWDDGRPSDMLEDRLKRSVELYMQGSAPKLLMSGDHGTVSYNEVASMRQYALDAQVPSEDVFMDHAGFCTYDSIYRAKEVFKADKILIVSQEYHLYRALFLANMLGVEAYGVSADYRNYSGQLNRDVREILARAKDAVMGLVQPEPTFLGEAIPVSGDGNLTNDATETTEKFY